MDHNDQNTAGESLTAINPPQETPKRFGPTILQRMEQKRRALKEAQMRSDNRDNEPIEAE